MKKSDIWFVIVTYKPDEAAIARLKASLAGWPVIILDNTEHNLGFGAAANRGMREAFDAGAGWVVILNQDVWVTRAGITQFCAMAQSCDPGIVGPEAGSLDGKRWTTILHKATPKKPDYISGSMIAIHRNVWERIGGFWEPYFLYYEDVDLCLRARRAGFRIQQITIEGFRHMPHASKYYLARNHLWFVFRLAPWRIKLREFIRLPKTVWEYVYDDRG